MHVYEKYKPFMGKRTVGRRRNTQVGWKQVCHTVYLISFHQNKSYEETAVQCHNVTRLSSKSKHVCYSVLCTFCDNWHLS